MSDRPCPFCGATLVRLESDEREYRKAYGVEGYTEYYVYCPMCGARGPNAYRCHRSVETVRQEAIEKWNRRWPK